jgi:dienelactone hydrolase
MMRLSRLFLCSFAATAFPSCTTLSMMRTPAGDSIQRFSSGGKSIRIETFGIVRDTNRPSIVLLHGATGVDFGKRFIARFAEAFASEGYVVHLVHYFDLTGTEYADDETIRTSSAAWQRAVDDAVRLIRKSRPNARIGVFGYSLGGYLAAAESVRNRQVAATVVLAGGLDKGSALGVRHTPPTLILHGSADNRVPISEARRLESTLKAAGANPEFHVYPGEGHIMNLSSYKDVMLRSVRFFDRHLKTP